MSENLAGLEYTVLEYGLKVPLSAKNRVTLIFERQPTAAELSALGNWNYHFERLLHPPEPTKKDDDDHADALAAQPTDDHADALAAQPTIEGAPV